VEHDTKVEYDDDDDCPPVAAIEQPSDSGPTEHQQHSSSVSNSKSRSRSSSNNEASLRLVWERYLTQLGPGALRVVEQLSLDHTLFHENCQLTNQVLKSLPDQGQLPKGYVEGLWESIETLRSKVVGIISKQVREHHEVFMQGIVNIHDIGLDVAQTRVLCHNTRQALKAADQGLVLGITSVLVKKRRKARMMSLISHLSRIRSALLLEAELDLQLTRDDFPSAILAYRRCHCAVQSLPPFSCLAGLRERMRTGKSLIKRRLREKLGLLCRTFNRRDLLSVLHTYRMLEEDGLLGADLKEAYMNAVVQIVHEALVDAVLGSRRTQLDTDTGVNGADLPRGGPEEEERLSRLRVRELCELLTSERYAGCVLRILSQMSRLLLSYHRVQQHFERLHTQLEKNLQNKIDADGDHAKLLDAKLADAKLADTKLADAKQGLVLDDDDSGSDEGMRFDILGALLRLGRRSSGSVSTQPVPHRDTTANYVSTLRLNSKVLWQYVQAKTAVVVNTSSMDTANLPVEDFLEVLACTERFLSVGELLTDSREEHSMSLRGAIKLKSTEYFQRFHSQSFERLRLLMESETWRRLPLPDLRVGDVMKLSVRVDPLLALDKHQLLDKLKQGHDLFRTKTTNNGDANADADADADDGADDDTD